MKCPVDDTDLVMTDRQGVEIDYCPKCRGIWLDRNELDKIIERAASSNDRQYDVRRDDRREEDRYENHDRQRYEERRDYDDDYDRRSGYHDGHHKKHKKEGFLGDLFDF